MILIDLFKKIYCALCILFYITIHTSVWGLFYPFFSSSDIYEAGALDGLYRMEISFALMGKNKNNINQFKGIVMTAHKGFCDFFGSVAFGFPSSVSRFVYSCKTQKFFVIVLLLLSYLD